MGSDTRLALSRPPAPSLQCGCLCTTCCSSASGVEVCRPAGVGSQCLAANETCRTYDTEQCGRQYSDSQQANWCQNPSPSSWPALMQAASEGFLAQPWAPAAPVLYTGAGKEAADEMAGRMFTAVPPSAVQREEAAALLREGTDSVRPGGPSASAAACLAACTRVLPTPP